MHVNVKCSFYSVSIDQVLEKLVLLLNEHFLLFFQSV